MPRPHGSRSLTHLVDPALRFVISNTTEAGYAPGDADVTGRAAGRDSRGGPASFPAKLLEVLLAHDVRAARPGPPAV